MLISVRTVNSPDGKADALVHAAQVGAFIRGTGDTLIIDLGGSQLVSVDPGWKDLPEIIKKINGG